MPFRFTDEDAIHPFRAVSASTGMTTFVDNEADNTATTQNALQTSVTTDEIRIVGLTYAGANGGRVFSRVALKVAQVPSHVLIAGFGFQKVAPGRMPFRFTDEDAIHPFRGVR